MDKVSKETTVRYLQTLAGSRPAGISDGLESTENSALAEERARIAHERAVKIAEREWGDALTPELMAELEKTYLEDGLEGLKRLRNDGADAVLTSNHLAGLEAIVETDGSRPSVRIGPDDTIDTTNNTLGMWKNVAADYAACIHDIATAVGRIDLDGIHKGTGFVISDDLVLTNRHVLQQIAREQGDGLWSFKARASITFDADPDATRKREFTLKRIARAADERILEPIDYSKLDFAIVQCNVATGSRLPAPLKLESDASNIVNSRPVYTIGYPAKPPTGVYKFGVLKRLLGNVFGVKHFAPGEIDLELGNKSATVFAHDATTLGGNSGSCVVDFGDTGLSVAGLHFAGFKERANYAHATAMLKQAFGNVALSWLP